MHLEPPRSAGAHHLATARAAARVSVDLLLRPAWPRRVVSRWDLGADGAQHVRAVEWKVIEQMPAQVKRMRVSSPSMGFYDFE
jgi:hypothetical protein